MRKVLMCLACVALGCGTEGPAAVGEPVGAVAQPFTLEPEPLTHDVITSLNRLDPAPNFRSMIGAFNVSPRGDCHHVQSAARHKEYYLLSHSMPDQAHLAVVDPNGVLVKVPLLSGGSGRNQVHPGGIQVMGDVLAVALADEPNCGVAPLPPILPDVVRFYDISTPLSPVPGALPDLVPGSSAQAVAATRLGASTVVAVLTGTRSLRFFKLADGTTTWVNAGGWDAAVEADDTYEPAEDQKYCSRSGLQWCRPDTINLYRETTGALDRAKLLTFSRGTKDRAFDRERIGVYEVTGLGQGQTPAVSHKKTYEFLPVGTDGDFRYGGGSEITDDGALMAFAFPSDLSDGGETPFARYGGWSKALEYDSGRNAVIALNDSEVAVQVHKATNGDKLYYRIGQLDKATRQVSWGSSVYWRNGAKPSVAMDGQGNVVVLHTVYDEVTPEIFSCVGKANPTARTIEWYPCEVIDTGRNPTVAMSKDGGVIEVHNGSSEANQRTLYARVGRLDVANHRVSFGASQSFDTGADSSVTLNKAGTVVEAHNGTTATTERNLYFTVGQANFDTKTVTWGSSSKHGTGTQLSIGLNDNHKLVALHHDLTEDDENGIYFAFGNPDSSTKTIDWKPEVGGLRDIGTDAAVAIATDGLLLETHSAPSSSTATAIWYSAADLRRLP